MSHAANKRERHHQIEQLLLRGKWTPSEIAARIGCHRVTVHRDLLEIAQNHNLKQDDDGRYWLNPAEYVSNVKLSPAEAMSIYLALRRFARQTSHAPAFVITALQKIAPALRHPTLTEQLQQACNELESDRLASNEHAAIWQTILEGWREGIVVRIEYVKRRATEADTHEIEPYLFEPAILSHGDYVIARSRTRHNRLTTFKISRIRRAALTTARFEKPADLDFNDLLKTAWGIWYGKQTVTVELLFSPDVASRVQETRWHPSQQVEEQSDGSLYWCVEVAATEELRSWVRGWGHEVKVLGPPAFRHQILSDLQNALQLYETNEER